MALPLKNILCIDDESDILDIAKFALENLGHFHLETCSGGSEALNRADSLHPDMILLDVMMPGMDGCELFQRLRQLPNFANVPVVFMTAKVRPFEVMDYLEMGIEGIIPKPFDPLALPKSVESFWQSYNNRKQTETDKAPS